MRLAASQFSREDPSGLDNFHAEPSNKGRVLVSAWQDKRTRIHCIDVHNRDLAEGTMHKLETCLRKTKSCVAQRPWDVGLVLAGDLNHVDANKYAFYLSSGTVTTCEPSSSHRPVEWMRMISEMT